MIQVLCNGKCQIDPDCFCHNPHFPEMTVSDPLNYSRVAQKCPVCDGKGNVPDDNMRAMTAMAYKTCNGCFGKGWVAV